MLLHPPQLKKPSAFKFSAKVGPLTKRDSPSYQTDNLNSNSTQSREESIANLKKYKESLEKVSRTPFNYSPGITNDPEDMARIIEAFDQKQPEIKEAEKLLAQLTDKPPNLRKYPDSDKRAVEKRHHQAVVDAQKALSDIKDGLVQFKTKDREGKNYTAYGTPEYIAYIQKNEFNKRVQQEIIDKVKAQILQEESALMRLNLQNPTEVATQRGVQKVEKLNEQKDILPTQSNAIPNPDTKHQMELGQKEIQALFNHYSSYNAINSSFSNKAFAETKNLVDKYRKSLSREDFKLLINTTDSREKTLLHLAATHGLNKVVQYLTTQTPIRFDIRAHNLLTPLDYVRKDQPKFSNQIEQILIKAQQNTPLDQEFQKSIDQVFRVRKNGSVEFISRLEKPDLEEFVNEHFVEKGLLDYPGADTQNTILLYLVKSLLGIDSDKEQKVLSMIQHVLENGANPGMGYVAQDLKASKSRIASYITPLSYCEKYLKEHKTIYNLLNKYSISPGPIELLNDIADFSKQIVTHWFYRGFLYFFPGRS